MLSQERHTIGKRGADFIKYQQRLISFSIPAAVTLLILLTAGVIFRTGFNLQGIVISLGGNVLNYFLNVEYNFFRRKKVLDYLVKETEMQDDFPFKTFSSQSFQKEDFKIREDSSKLFSEFDKFKIRYVIEAGEDDFIFLPELFSVMQ